MAHPLAFWDLVHVWAWVVHHALQVAVSYMISINVWPSVLCQGCWGLATLVPLNMSPLQFVWTLPDPVLTSQDHICMPFFWVNQVGDCMRTRDNLPLHKNWHLGVGAEGAKWNKVIRIPNNSHSSLQNALWSWPSPGTIIFPITQFAKHHPSII